MNERTNTLVETIANEISGISDAVGERVVEIVSDRETEKRANAIDQGLVRLRDLEREIKGLETPRDRRLDREGNAIEGSESFTQEQINERKGKEKQRDKLVVALEKALNGDMDKLYKLMKTRINRRCECSTE